jgi:uncharacterized Zn finger protein (UPF0148 family)
MTEERFIEVFESYVNQKEELKYKCSACGCDTLLIEDGNVYCFDCAKEIAQQPNQVSDDDVKYVIELSDNELKIVTHYELMEMKNDAMKFDGFEGWVVRGKLINAKATK